MTRSSLTLAAACLAAAVTLPSARAQEATPAVRDAIARLRAGAAFDGDGKRYLGADGRVDGPALDLLVRALRETQDDPRCEVARALVAAGRAGDALAARGGDAIRDPRVVAALVDPGLARADGAKEVCLDALLAAVPPALLAPHGAALVACLRAGADPTVALALAKAKPAGARAALDEAIRADRGFGDTPEGRVARAALGDAAAERALIDAFVREQNPAKKASLARPLGLAQTPATLRALGEALRTPLVDASMSRRRSVRLDVLAALRLAFPDEPALFGEQIKDDAGYAAAERFVEQRLGVTWSAPRPPFLTEQGLPF